MDNFDSLVKKLLNEFVNSAATAFDSAGSGENGNQFPSQNSKAYNDGNNMPVAPANLALNKKVVKAKGKKVKAKKIIKNKTVQ